MARFEFAAVLVSVVSAATLPGIDVSHYQGAVNWKAVASSGQQVVYKPLDFAENPNLSAALFSSSQL